MAIQHDFGNGYYAVPYDAVTLNGIPLTQLNTRSEPYKGPFALIMPDRHRAAEGDDGRTPYRYDTLDEARDDAAVLARFR